MRSSSILLVMLSLALTASPVRASTIDDFVLTGVGNIITFSLPYSPPATPSVRAGGVVAGSYVPSDTPLVVDGSRGTASIEFLSGRIFVGPGLLIQSRLGNFIVVGALLSTGTAANPTFNTATFKLKDFYGTGLPYTLIITPEPVAAPEPGGLILLGTEVAALAAGVERHRRSLKSEGDSL